MEHSDTEFRIINEYLNKFIKFVCNDIYTYFLNLWKMLCEFKDTIMVPWVGNVVVLALMCLFVFLVLLFGGLLTLPQLFYYDNLFDGISLNISGASYDAFVYDEHVCLIYKTDKWMYLYKNCEIKQKYFFLDTNNSTYDKCIMTHNTQQICYTSQFTNLYIQHQWFTSVDKIGIIGNISEIIKLLDSAVINERPSFFIQAFYIIYSMCLMMIYLFMFCMFIIISIEGLTYYCKYCSKPVITTQTALTTTESSSKIPPVAEGLHACSIIIWICSAFVTYYMCYHEHEILFWSDLNLGWHCNFYRCLNNSDTLSKNTIQLIIKFNHLFLSICCLWGFYRTIYLPCTKYIANVHNKITEHVV